jgi:hypothetical protein
VSPFQSSALSSSHKKLGNVATPSVEVRPSRHEMFKEKHQAILDSITYLCETFGFDKETCKEVSKESENGDSSKKRPKTGTYKPTVTGDDDEPATLGNNY